MIVSIESCSFSTGPFILIKADPMSFARLGYNHGKLEPVGSASKFLTPAFVMMLPFVSKHMIVGIEVTLKCLNRRRRSSFASKGTRYLNSAIYRMIVDRSSITISCTYESN